MVSKADAAEAQGKKPLALRILGSVLSFAIDQWFLLSMGVLILLAYFFPIVGRKGGSIRSEYTVNYGGVAIIFLISGLSLPFDKLLKHAKNLRLHLIVQTYSFLLTSSVFFGIAVAASTNPYIETSALIGLIAVGCLPTTIASNVTMTREAGGDVAATMVSVTLGNLLGPFISPLLIARLYLPATAAFRVWIPSEAIGDLSPLYRNVMMQMGLSVYLPLVVGQIVRALFTDIVQKTVTKFKLAKVGTCMLLLLVWSTFCNAFDSGSLNRLNTATIVFIIFINLVLCISFTLLTFFTVRPPKAWNRWNGVLFKRVSKEEVISYCFCCPAKTQALGIPLLASMYVSSSNEVRSLIQIPVVLYTVEQVFVGQFMIWWFRRWLAKDQARLDQAALKKAEKGAIIGVEDKDQESAVESSVQGGVGGEDGTAGMAGTDGKIGEPGGLGGEGRSTVSLGADRRREVV